MSASPRSRSQSPLELWAGRGKEETAAKLVSNWRERRSQSPRGEREAGALSPAEIEIRRRRPMFGCGREQRLEKMRKECGMTLPAEQVLIDLHQRHKTGTNDFTTWLVQAVFPDGKDLPGYIVSDERQYKSGHKKYQISPVNEFMTMADLFANSEKAKYMPSRILQILADTIRDRSLYSHWQEVISTNNPEAQVTNNSHQHFIDVLEETRRILREKGNVPEMTSASLGKRKPSRPDFGGEKQKATKTMPWASETNQRPILAWRQADKQEPRQERDLVWRRGLAASGDKTESKLVSQQRTNVNRSCAAVVKPISYASALSVVKA